MFMTPGKNTGKEAGKTGAERSEYIDPVKDGKMLESPSILTGLSHEVRTYMNSIVAFTFLSNNEKCTDEEREEYNSHIMNSCDQLITLFDNFLDSALIDSDGPKSTVTNCNLRSLFQDMLNELNNSIRKFDKEKVTLIIDERQSDDSMFIDKEKINRVLKNLFFNALETTESGYIKIGYTKRKDRVEFYVIDSGNGYTRNLKLLEADAPGEDAFTPRNTFSTISFILSSKLIESMGGKLWIRPNGVNGTAMYFSIPANNNKKNYSEAISSRIAI